MKIGEALRVERLKMGLSQQQMCKGILSRPFYAKVESGKNGISAENLIRIIFAREIDIDGFLGLIKKSYMSKEDLLTERLQQEMYWIVNTKDIKLLEKYYNKIMSLSDDQILKLRMMITTAYFKGDLEKIDKKSVREELKKEFDEGKNWFNRPKVLRLFANTMPLWSQEDLDFFIGRLLAEIKENEISETMLERYLRILGNYLVTCYERKTFQKNFNTHIEEVIRYIITQTTDFHLMIYRLHAIYMKDLFENNKEKAELIKKDMSRYGYEDQIASWPE